jgi:hypothetical protein
VSDVADLDAALEQLVARRSEILDHRVDPADRAGSGVREPHPDLDRARRPRRGQLDDAEVVAGPVVDVERESALLAVEGERPVDVADRQDQHLDLYVM